MQLNVRHPTGRGDGRLETGEGECFCGLEVADMWHGLFECERAKVVWRQVERWWYKLGGVSPVEHPMCKVTTPNREVGEEVHGEIWRLLCACMIDVLWVDWTRWIHEGVAKSEAHIEDEWRNHVHESITVLWYRANRMQREQDIHVDYVPGCVWSRPKQNYIHQFTSVWCGELGSIDASSNWRTSATL